MSRAVSLCLAFAVVAACAEDVVIGRYRENAVVDAGDARSDSGVVDAGDAGTNDDGGADAGTVDAGDGGSNDGGLDGGLDAGLESDGGADAGLDAGQADAAVDLAVSLAGDWVLEADAGVQSWQLTLFNAGQLPVAAQRIDVSFSPSVVVSGVDCEDAGPGADGGPRVQCLAGALAPATTRTLALSVHVTGSTLRFYELTAEVPAALGESSLSNNRARQPIALTPVGAGAVAVGAPRTIALSACFGTVITSYAQCVPSSLIVGQGLLVSDGGFLDDGGTPGTWAVGSTGRNIVLMPPLGVAAPYSGYVGAGVSTSCFEGVVQSSSGRAYIGAWRGCLQ